ncbi:MAG: hypothetical protein LBH57_09170 [Treponema sp.]|jgi:hypothetical protein|nr:hypothetical protein [Treponema sp.]
MKKIIIALFIIVILGGTAFFFGWVQFRVPPGSYGVMRSKTHGVDTAVIREGEFRWVWYAVIPTNVEIAVFTPKPVDRPIRISGSLPSGDVYASFAGPDMDFSYEYAGFLSFMIRPDQLPALMQERGVANQEDLEAFEGRIAEEMLSFAARRLDEYAEEGIDLAESGMDTLREDVLGEFPYVENLSCSINAVQRPDTALYNSLKKIYGDYLAEQRQSPEPDNSPPASRHINTRLRLDELEKYGELLTKYPILLQYLALEKGGTGKDPEAAGD